MRFLVVLAKTIGYVHSAVRSAWRTLQVDASAAARSVRRKPLFAALFILAMTSGITAVTVVFSLVDAALLKPLPYPQPQGVVRVFVQSWASGKTWQGVSHEEQRLLIASGVLADTAEYDAFWPSPVSVTVAGTTEYARAAHVSATFFRVLRVVPVLGRSPATVAESESEVVLSHSFWLRVFGAQASAVGRQLSIGKRVMTVVGVMPPAFRYPAWSADRVPELLILDPATNVLTSKGTGVFCLLGRLKDAENLARAQIALDAVVRRADRGDRRGFNRLLLVPLQQSLTASSRQSIVLLLCAVVGLLALGTANVASLTAAHTASREQELATRVALGATNARLCLGLAIEALIMSLSAGLLACILSEWLLRVFLGLVPARYTPITEVRVDYRVVGFALIASVLAGLASVIGPGYRLTRLRTPESLNARRATIPVGAAGGRWLLGAQSALVCVLIIVGGLFLASWWRLATIDFGFSPAGLATVGVFASESDYPDVEASVRFLTAARDRLAALPTVESVASSEHLPLFGGDSGATVQVPASGVEGAINVWRVDSNYFGVLGAKVVRGRSFTRAEEHAGAPTAVINVSAARRFLGTVNPIGSRVLLDGAMRVEIVGVVEDLREGDYRRRPETSIYLPIAHSGSARFRQRVFLVRYRGRAIDHDIDELKKVVQSIDARIPARPQLMSSQLWAANSEERFHGWLVGSFALLGLFLAVLGIAGSTARDCAMRSAEIAVRLAIGGSRSRIVATQLRKVMLPIGAGVIAGAVGGQAGVRLLGALLFETTSLDYGVQFIAMGVLVAAALFSAWLPVWRATAIEPSKVMNTR